MSNFIINQNWRYSTKKFDASKKISPEDLNFLKEAIRLSSSSYGLQLYKIIIVESAELKMQLQPAAWGQSQIVDASHIFVFANQTTVADSDIDDYLKNTTDTRSLPENALKGYGDFMKSTIKARSAEDLKNWTAKQTYLALGNLLNAAAELKIDVTPMEGFDVAQFNSILGLDKLNLDATVIATVGYRHDEDVTQFNKKVRKSNESLFITL